MILSSGIFVVGNARDDESGPDPLGAELAGFFSIIPNYFQSAAIIWTLLQCIIEKCPPKPIATRKCAGDLQKKLIIYWLFDCPVKPRTEFLGFVSQIGLYCV
jgi:hypothetical protein